MERAINEGKVALLANGSDLSNGQSEDLSHIFFRIRIIRPVPPACLIPLPPGNGIERAWERKPIPRLCYSCRNAMMGLTRVARQAGRVVAIRAMAINVRLASTMTAGSRGRTP